MDISILEIRNAKCLMIDREWLAGIMPTAERIINGEIHTDKMKKKLQARVTMADSGNKFVMSEGCDDGNGNSSHSESNDSYLNVIFVEGLVTRHGGACTYGSKDIRNLMMAASDDENCKGHVIVLDTPGGMAVAVPDFKMAIDYARSKGLGVDGIIDGYCCSLGIYVGSMCDHLYYTSPTDRVGSVGTFGIFDVMKNGDVDPTTGEKHYEIYDPESYDKNDWYRQLSEEGKKDLIIEDLKRDGKVFRDFVKSRRPGCTDEMLHGKVYKCGEVEGSFVDGQRTMQEVFNEVMAHYYETHKNAKNNLSTQLNNSIKMKEKFPALFAALQVEEMQMQEDGAFMNEGLLATLNEAIEEHQKAAADAKALADQLTTEKAELQQQLETANAEHATAIEALNTAHTEHVANLNALIEEKQNAIAALEQEKAQLQGDMEGQKAQIEQLTTERDEAKASLETANGTIAERDQQISDLNAQIEDLNKEPGAGAQAGSPANNGAGVEEAEVVISTQYVIDPNKSYEENMKAKKEWEAARK